MDVAGTGILSDVNTIFTLKENIKITLSKVFLGGKHCFALTGFGKSSVEASHGAVTHG